MGETFSYIFYSLCQKKNYVYFLTIDIVFPDGSGVRLNVTFVTSVEETYTPTKVIYKLFDFVELFHNSNAFISYSCNGFFEIQDLHFPFMSTQLTCCWNN